MSQQTRSQRAATAQIGRRCYWSGKPDILGTIRSVEHGRGGWPVFLVRWDDGAPDWWSERVSPANKSFVVVEPEPT